jgi:fibronectin-binding autotransporter adhesin
MLSRRSTRSMLARKPGTYRPELDALEDRLVLSHTVAVAVVDPPATFLEGTPVALTATVGGTVVGPLTFAWSVNGTTVDGATAADFSFTPDDNGSFLVEVSVADGAETVLANTTLTVENQAPVAGITGDTVGVPGLALNFTLTATDAAADAAAGFTYDIDWDNDGVIDETIPATADNGLGVNVSHVFDALGTFTVSVTATDKDGAVSAPATLEVTISETAVVDGTLFVTGTDGDDVIKISPSGKPSASDATVRVKVNGETTIHTGVNAIVVHGLEGNDKIHLAGSIKLPATLYGDAGNDRLKGGKGADVLVGGDDNDHLNGHKGEDILIGGEGADRLLGGPNDDILIGGSTQYDADQDLLDLLSEAWSAGGSLSDRVAAVRDATAAAFLSVADGTVMDDGDADKLTGASGTDWFFADTPQDRITGRQGKEVLNDDDVTTAGKGKGPGAGTTGGRGKGKGKGK